MKENSRENSIAQRVSEIEKDITDFKKTQFVGASSLIIYNNQTSNIWDVNLAFMDGANAETLFRVTFTPDDGLVNYCEFEFDYQIVLNSSSFDFPFYASDDPYSARDTTSKSFLVWHLNSIDDQTVNLKFGVRSTKLGTITWERII